MKPKSIILLSGGLDSTVSATIAARKTRPVFALTIDYGQRAAKMEIFASKRICRVLKIKHRVIKLPFFKEFKKCELMGDNIKKFSKKFLTLKNIWVPNRNSLFINIAASFADYYRADIIVTGFNREEAREFPDNTRDFINSINKTFQFSTLRKIKVVSYVANYTKKEIYKLGLRYKAPLQYIYSCYLGSKKMCGRCPSCRKLIEAKKQY